MKNTSKLFLTFLLLTILFLTACQPAPINVYSNQDNAQQINKISVNGAYNADVEPDQSEIYLTVRTESQDSITAQRDNAGTANEIIRALKGNGIKEEDIETISYNVDLIQEWDPETYKYVKNGIRVTNSMKVKTKDLDNVGKVLDAIISVSTAGKSIVEINSVQFTLSQEKQRDVNAELLGKAAENAKAKAEGIAKALDLSIVKVVSISESNVYIPIPYYAKADVMTLGAAEAREPTPISPGTVSASANVNVVFEIS